MELSSRWRGSKIVDLLFDAIRKCLSNICNETSQDKKEEEKEIGGNLSLIKTVYFKVF